jgi:GTP-binding protein LepA
LQVRDERPVEPLAGYCEPVPVVYCGLFPVDTTQYQLLRESLERLRLNDAALVWEPETSSAMGFGFRTGFLGLLHVRRAPSQHTTHKQRKQDAASCC